MAPAVGRTSKNATRKVFLLYLYTIQVDLNLSSVMYNHLLETQAKIYHPRELSEKNGQAAFL